MKKNTGDLKISLKQARKLVVLERLWGTLQHRLVVDMRLAGITTIEEAKAFLATYPDKHIEDVHQKIFYAPDEYEIQA
ncbi:MAG: hypothetical protein H5T90_05720 [Acetomicrobium sp.]|nr:hypothetical protein [Acetomicrobium sp.]